METNFRQSIQKRANMRKVCFDNQLIMGKFTSQTVGRLLLATNILTATVLTVVFIKEKYPSKVYHKFFKEKIWSYADNTAYEKCMTVYSLYHEQKNIVMLGNSLTAYANWAELLNRPDIANRGIGGDITAGFIARLNYVINVKPKICFIEGGVNDIGRGIHQDTILKNLTSIVDTLQRNNIKPVLTTVTLVTKQYHYKSKNPVEINKKIKELNKEIFKLAKEKNIKLIDLNSYISDENFRISEYAVKDGIHFTGKTYLIWKHELQKILNQEDI
jgi:lysophospholipase L1-like esterase